jgi:hypothetical protein
MQANVPNDKRLRGGLTSLWSFQGKLSELGSYHADCKRIEEQSLSFSNSSMN